MSSHYKSDKEEQAILAMWKRITVLVDVTFTVKLCPLKKKHVCLKLLSLIIPFFLFSPVFDLLPSSSQRLNPAVLQPILTDPTLNEVYVISTFKLHTKSSATIFGLYSSTDNSKYLEFTVMGRLNKGKHICRNHFLKNLLFLFQHLGSTCLKCFPPTILFSSTIRFSFQYQVLLIVH